MATKLTGNPFRARSKASIYFNACNVDLETGFSDVIEHDQLCQLGLETDNGGSWCRSDGTLGKHFEIYRAKLKGKIYSVQLVGYKQNDFTGKIANVIAEKYKHDNCRILSVKGKYIEIDHKDGRKNDYKLHDNQTVDDFQPLHKCCNVAKRQHCKVCTETGLKFNAMLLGYSVAQHIGPIEYHGSCIGCYWYDPKEFNSIISSGFVKKR